MTFRSGFREPVAAVISTESTVMRYACYQPDALEPWQTDVPRLGDLAQDFNVALRECFPPLKRLLLAGELHRGVQGGEPYWRLDGCKVAFS